MTHRRQTILTYRNTKASQHKLPKNANYSIIVTSTQTPLHYHPMALLFTAVALIIPTGAGNLESKLCDGSNYFLGPRRRCMAPVVSSCGEQKLLVTSYVMCAGWKQSTTKVFTNPGKYCRRFRHVTSESQSLAAYTSPVPHTIQ